MVLWGLGVQASVEGIQVRGISAWVSGSKPAEEALPTEGQPRLGWQNPKGVRRASPWVVAGCRTSNPTWGEAGAEWWGGGGHGCGGGVRHHARLSFSSQHSLICGMQVRTPKISSTVILDTWKDFSVSGSLALPLIRASTYEFGGGHRHAVHGR